MHWDAFERVVRKMGHKLIDEPTFREVGLLYGTRAFVEAGIARHDMDSEEAAVVLELATRISPAWRLPRRRAR